MSNMPPIAKKREYYDVFSVVSFNTAERKKIYYQKNGMKIIGHFLYRTLLPDVRINTSRAHGIRVLVGANSNPYIYNARYCPDVEFVFDVINFQHICFTAITEQYTEGVFKRKVDEKMVYSLASLIPIMRKYLQLTVSRFSSPQDTIEFDTREPWSEMTIHNSRYELIDYMPLYEMSADALIRIIFIAIDSEYLHVPVDYHPIYNN